MDRSPYIFIIVELLCDVEVENSTVSLISGKDTTFEFIVVPAFFSA